MWSPKKTLPCFISHSRSLGLLPRKNKNIYVLFCRIWMKVEFSSQQRETCLTNQHGQCDVMQLQTCNEYIAGVLTKQRVEKIQGWNCHLLTQFLLFFESAI